MIIEIYIIITTELYILLVYCILSYPIYSYMYSQFFDYILAGLYQSSRTLATETNKKHFKCKLVDNVMVMTMDSPGVKVVLHMTIEITLKLKYISKK